MALISFWFVLILNNRYEIKYFTAFLLICATVVQFTVAVYLNVPPESDFLMLYDAARCVIQGDLSFHDTVYFSLWSYQSVFVVWESLFLFFFDDPIILYFVNSFLSASILCLIYRLMINDVNKKIARIISCMMLIFPFFLTWPAILSNQIPSAFFFVLAIWILFSRDTLQLRKFRFLGAGVCLQIGNLLRPEGILILVALIVVLMIQSMKKGEKKKNIFSGIVIMVLAYYVLFGIANYIVQSTGLNQNGLRNGNPMWKFVTGLNYETMGGYSASDWELIYPTLDDQNKVTEETIEIQKTMLTQRLNSSVSHLAKHLIHKLQYLWCVDSLNWTLSNKFSESLTGIYELFRKFDRVIWGIILFLSGYGAAYNWKNEMASRTFLVYLIILIASCAFLLIEVQPRYSYLPNIFLFWSASNGLKAISNNLERNKLG